MEEAENDDHDINSKWAKFSKAYNNTAENVLGRKRKSSKPWISSESWVKVEERKQLKGKAENAKWVLSLKGSNDNYVQNTGVKTRR